MRQFKLLTIALFFSCFLISCKTSGIRKTVLIIEKESIGESGYQLVETENLIPGLLPVQILGTPEVISPDIIRYEFETDVNLELQLVGGKYPRLPYDIQVRPGDSLIITQSAWNSDSSYFELKGKFDQALVQYKYDFPVNPSSSRSAASPYRSDRYSSTQQYFQALDSLFDLRKSHIERQVKIDPTQKIYEIQHADLLAEKLQYLVSIISEENNEDLLYSRVINDSYDLIKQADKFSSMHIKNVVSRLLELKAKMRYFSKHQTDSLWWDERYDNKIEVIRKENVSAIKEIMTLLLIQDFSYEMFKNDFFQNLTSQESQLRQSIYNPSALTLFENNIKIYTRLAPGQPAPEIRLPNSNGDTISTSDFKGKIVYIDFWGTWCMPCLKEIPAQVELQESLNGEDVVFINIALQAKGEQVDEWQSFVNGSSELLNRVNDGLPYPGIHLIAESQFYNPAISEYQLNFAPTYVLIDKNGDLVSSRAARPSDIYEQISSLLEH